MPYKHKEDRHDPKYPQIREKMGSAMQGAEPKGYEAKNIPLAPTAKSEKATRKTIKARAYSFSMEPPLYTNFIDMCRERNVNASACVRNLMLLQMKAWRTGEHDESLREID